VNNTNKGESINKAYRDIDAALFSLLVRDSKKGEMGIFWMVCGDTNHGDDIETEVTNFYYF